MSREQSRGRRRLRGRTLALGLALAGTAALLGAGAPAASAAICGDNIPPPWLFDAGGYYFDFDLGSTTGANRNQPFATLLDSGSNGPLDDPPGPVLTSDSYDHWGSLFVGPGGDASEANLYHSDDNDSCTDEDGGREHVYPQLALNGLLVQRKIFVSDSGLAGARILNLISNPSSSPITTDVQVGDTLSNDQASDLGSDTATAVRSSSSGDLALSAADLWAVTSDHIGGVTNGDPALAHVIDGPGGRERIDFATHTGSVAGSTQDNLAWRWEDIRIQPGQTIALVSYEVQAALAGRNAANEDAAAKDQALTYQEGGLTDLYAGMSIAERAAVANWANPVRCGGRPVTIAGTPGPDVIVGTPGPDVVVGLGGNDRIFTGAGNDVVCAGQGADRVATHAGVDRAFGQAGGDLLLGGGQRDWLFGGQGHDRAFGGTGRDLLVGGQGRDRLYGGAQRDALRGLAGRPDLCHGGPGRDLRRAPGCEIRRSIP